MRCGNVFGRIYLFVCVSVCNSQTLALTWKVYFSYEGISSKIFRSNSYIKVIGSRSRSEEQKRGILPHHPLLWQTSCSLAATAMAASPFQSFRVWRYVPVGTVHGAPRRRRREQTSNCWSATGRPAICGIQISDPADRPCNGRACPCTSFVSLPRTEKQSCFISLAFWDSVSLTFTSFYAVHDLHCHHSGLPPLLHSFILSHYLCYLCFSSIDIFIHLRLYVCGFQLSVPWLCLLHYEMCIKIFVYLQREQQHFCRMIQIQDLDGSS